MATDSVAGDGHSGAPSNSGILADEKSHVSTALESSMESMAGDVAQSKCLEQQDVKVTPEKSKCDGIPLRKALIIEL